MEINFVADNQTAELEKFEGEIDKLERDSGFHSIPQAHNRVKPKDKQIVFLAEITGFNSVTSSFRQVDRNQNTPWPDPYTQTTLVIVGRKTGKKLGTP